MRVGGTIGAVAADWSGARRDEHRRLWLAEWDTGEQAVTSVRPMGRRDAGSRILDLAERNPELVTGLDFSFSLPAWWLRANAIDSGPALWADADRLEEWLARCDPPFWGRPGRRRPPLAPEAAYRLTELAAPRRPGSTFQIGGAGAVGTASLRGMPTLQRLQAAGVAVWPFDRWRLPAAVEVWPRLSIGGATKSSRPTREAWAATPGRPLTPPVAEAVAASEDAFDAVAAVIDLARRGALARPAAPDPVIVLEGWIDGVALPVPAPARSVSPARRGP